MNIIFLFLLFFAIIIIVINLTKLNFKCPEAQIVYRYLPHKILDQQFLDNMPTDLFKQMFTQTTPWVSSVMDYDRYKSESVNHYFISQI